MKTRNEIINGIKMKLDQVSMNVDYMGRIPEMKEQAKESEDLLKECKKFLEELKD
jgi:hypothetical protein